MQLLAILSVSQVLARPSEWPGLFSRRMRRFFFGRLARFSDVNVDAAHAEVFARLVPNFLGTCR
jgi:hypothetical protein